MSILKTVVMIFAVLALGVEPQRRSVGSGSVAGRVFDAATGRPIVGARVSLHQTRGGYRAEQISTDALGGFRFTDLATGSFSIDASADTYLSGAVGKLRAHGHAVWVTLSPGEHTGDLTIPMFRAAVLSGRVVDEQGKPVPGFWVAAWPRSRRRILGDDTAIVPSAKTDSNGDYRIGDAAPGDYVLVAAIGHHTYRQAEPGTSSCEPPVPSLAPLPPDSAPIVMGVPAIASITTPESAAATARPVGALYSRLWPEVPQPKPRADGTPMTYRTIFFPGVTQIADASTITVGSGESHAGLNFQLQPVPATTVSGTLTSAEGVRYGGEVRLRLVGDPARESGEAMTWLHAGSGAFTLLDVPAGRYYLHPRIYAALPGCDTIELDPESELTRLELDVPSAGLKDLVVPLTRSVSVTGSVVLIGARKPPDHIDVDLLPMDPGSGQRRPSGDVAGGRLAVRGVLPGAYELQASDNAITPSWWLESVTAGGRDVTGLPLMIGPDGIDDIRVVMTDRPTSLRGTVSTTANQLLADATVVLFPVDRKTWTNARIGSLRFQTSRALRGFFEFANVPAGDYLIAAVDEQAMDAWPSVAFLQRTAVPARRVTVRHGLAQTLSLTVAR